MSSVPRGVKDLSQKKTIRVNSWRSLELERTTAKSVRKINSIRRFMELNWMRTWHSDWSRTAAVGICHWNCRAPSSSSVMRYAPLLFVPFTYSHFLFLCSLWRLFFWDWTISLFLFFRRWNSSHRQRIISDSKDTKNVHKLKILLCFSVLLITSQNFRLSQRRWRQQWSINIVVWKIADESPQPKTFLALVNWIYCTVFLPFVHHQFVNLSLLWFLCVGWM